MGSNSSNVKSDRLWSICGCRTCSSACWIIRSTTVGIPIRRIVELEAKLTGEAEQPRQPEIVVHIREFGPSGDSKEHQKVRSQQLEPIIGLPAGDEIIDAEFVDCSDVMQ